MRTCRIALSYLALCGAIHGLYTEGLHVESDEIHIPLESGELVIEEARFIHPYYGVDAPLLTFTLINRTKETWQKLVLHFDISGVCNGEARQWSGTVTTGLNHWEDQEVRRSLSEMLEPFVGKVRGCRAEGIKAQLLLAESRNLRINIATGERTNLIAERKAEEAASKERRRVEAEKAAVATAAEVERLKLQAAEGRKRALADETKRRKRLAEEEARAKRAREVREAAEAEERIRLRSACSKIYEKTADKRIADLTVREEQQVRACQALGIYSPR